MHARMNVLEYLCMNGHDTIWDQAIDAKVWVNE